MGYLNLVDDLMREPDYDFEAWRVRLARHVNGALVRATRRPSNDLKKSMDVHALSALRRSLGNYD